MSIVLAILISIAICILSAVLEGVMAGGNVRQYFTTLRQPRFAISLKGWFAIGGIYYVVCGVVLYRLLRYDGDSTLRNVAFVLLVLMMIANAFWNYIFFRARNLFVSLVGFGPYIAITLALIYRLTSRRHRFASRQPVQIVEPRQNKKGLIVNSRKRSDLKEFTTFNILRELRLAGQASSW